MGETVKGYKVFNSDWTCYGKQYACPGKFEEDVELKLCNSGMHFCKKLVDCFNYYVFNPKNKVAEVVAYGNVVSEGDKSCTDKLEIVQELTWSEVLNIVNSGNGNSGYGNSGDWNNTDFSSGCFCTEIENVRFFNKYSTWTLVNWRNSKACQILSNLPHDELKWIPYDDMSDDDKKAHPKAETTEGLFKTKIISTKDKQDWWDSLSMNDKKEVLSLPNFDSDIFKEITGICVDK